MATERRQVVVDCHLSAGPPDFGEPGAPSEEWVDYWWRENAPSQKLPWGER
jgi:hypothetical protein